MDPFTIEDRFAGAKGFFWLTGIFYFVWEFTFGVVLSLAGLDSTSYSTSWVIITDFLEFFLDMLFSFKFTFQVA